MNFLKNPRQMEKVKLDVHEAYTLWRAYTDRNITLGHMSYLKNFVHDNDFTVYLSQALKDIKRESNNIEKLLQQYSIIGPEPAVTEHNVAGNSEIIRDQEVAEVLYRFLRLDVEYILPEPAGSMSSTASDMANFMIAHLDDSVNSEGPILRKETLKKMHKQHFTHYPALEGV